MSRSQIEMIGLVVVVIIIAIGFLLYIKFGVLRDQSNAEDPTIEVAYLTNLMGAVLNIKVCDQAPVKVEEALIKCYENEPFCDASEPCIYVKSEIEEIIGSVGLKNYKNYSVWIEKGSDKVDIIPRCETGILSHTTLVTANNEHYTAYFRVC